MSTSTVPPEAAAARPSERDKPDNFTFAALTVPCLLWILLNAAAHAYYGNVTGSYTLIDLDSLTQTSRVVYGIATLLVPASIGILLSLGCLLTSHRRRGRWWRSLLLLVLWGTVAGLIVMLAEGIPLPF